MGKNEQLDIKEELRTAGSSMYRFGKSAEELKNDLESIGKKSSEGSVQSAQIKDMLFDQIKRIYRASVCAGPIDLSYLSLAMSLAVTAYKSV